MVLGTDVMSANVTEFNGVAATSSSGRPEVNTTHAAGTAWGSGAITAGSIASDAITAAKIASGALDADAFATGAITSAKFAAGAIDAAAIANNAIDAATLAADVSTAIQAAANAALVANHLDHLLAADYDPSSKPGIATALLNELVENDGGVSRFTSNALEEAPTGGGGGGGATLLSSGTAQAGGSSSLTLAAGEPNDEDLYVLATLNLVGGTGSGQTRQIVSYSTSRVATVNEAWAVTPDATTDYEILGSGISAATLTDIENAVWDADPANHVGVNTFGGDGVPADIIAINHDTGAAGTMEATFDGSGVTLTGVVLPWPAAWDAEVQSEVQDAIEANHLDHLLAASYDSASKPGNASSLLNVMVENDAGVPRFTPNALEQAPTGAGGDGSAFTNIPWNAAWDSEVQSEVVDGLGAYSAPTTTYLDGRSLESANYATASQVTAVETDTQNIQTRLPDSLENGRMRCKVEQITDVVLTQGGAGGQAIGGA
jgi:hypothetical protein